MKRASMLAALVLCALSLSGCIAVSAREIHDGARYQAVATPDGKIFVVDRCEMTACEVTTYKSCEPDES